MKFKAKSISRSMSLAALSLVVVPALAACGGGAPADSPTAGQSSGSAPTTAAATTGTGSNAAGPRFEGQTVTVAVGSFMSSGVTMFKDAWEKRTGAKLQVVEIPFGDLYQRLFTSFSSGAKEFDVAVYAANWIPEFAQANYIMPLEKYYPQKDNWNDVLDKVKRIMYVNGQRYSVPLDGDMFIGYYRKDALENPDYQAKFKAKYNYDLAAPTTWKQYHDIAEFFTGWDWAKSGKPGWGVLEAQGPKDVGPYVLSARAAAYAANPNVPGSFFFNPDTMEPSVNDPGWTQALQDWIDIKKFGPPEMAKYGGGDMRGNFVAGNYALAIDWADTGIQAQDESSSIVKGKLGYFMLPGANKAWNVNTKQWDNFDKPSQAPYGAWGGWHGSIAASSKSPDAAWDFLNFIDNNENSLAAVTTPGTARNPYRTQHYANADAWTTAPVHYKDPAPYLKAIKDSMDHPNFQYDVRIPKAGQYFDVLDNWMQRALAGGMSAQDALNHVADEWKGITNKQGLDQQKKLYREVEGLK